MNLNFERVCCRQRTAHTGANVAWLVPADASTTSPNNLLVKIGRSLLFGGRSEGGFKVLQLAAKPPRVAAVFCESQEPRPSAKACHVARFVPPVVPAALLSLRLCPCSSLHNIQGKKYWCLYGVLCSERLAARLSRCLPRHARFATGRFAPGARRTPCSPRGSVRGKRGQTLQGSSYSDQLSKGRGLSAGAGRLGEN